MPIDPHPRSAEHDPRAVQYQIDPYKGTVLYQLLQELAAGAPLEVGWVYVTGMSRVDSVEHWLLYTAVNDQAAQANKAAYTWPTGTSVPVGLQFQFVRVNPDFDPVQYKATLEASGVKAVHIKATCTPGS